MTIQDLEPLITAQLALGMAALGIPVEAFPERPAEYRLTHPIGKALVIYSGSTNGPEITDMPISYERETSWTLALMVRGLKVPKGAYAAVEAGIAAMDAWTPPGCRRARVAKDSLRAASIMLRQERVRRRAFCGALRRAGGAFSSSQATGRAWW